MKIGRNISYVIIALSLCITLAFAPMSTAFADEKSKSAEEKASEKKKEDNSEEEPDCE